jgi:hypothetical protein
MRGFGLAIIFGIIHRHLVVDLHRLADSAVPRPKTAAAGGGSRSSAEQLCCGTIEADQLGAVALG